MTQQEIAKAIREGAMAFLHKEYKILFIFVILVGALLWFFLDQAIAYTFVLGAVFSALAGNLGMRTATRYNLKTVEAARQGLIPALRQAFRAGSIMGLLVVILGLVGIIISYYFFRDPQIIYGFGFGASAIALFARVGGGIYTKAADVGADLVGKIEEGIPEDDPRNPAVIADNVGDNVGDVAGMGADLFESYVDSIIAAMVLAGLALWQPIILALAGLGTSIIGIIFINLRKSEEPHKILNSGIFLAAILFAGAAYFIVELTLFWIVLAGLVAGIIIGLITEFYTSHNFKPTQNLAKSAQTGAGTNIISGLALGKISTIIPVLVVAAVIYLAYSLAGLYGIALAAVGMLATLGITLATDTYGPVADNAAGIAEMAGMGTEVRRRTEELDAVGNTTAAIGKGFAIGSAGLTALVLAVSFAQIANISVVNLLEPKVVIGLMIGGLLPFIFSSLSMSAVAKSAQAVIKEAREQFKRGGNPDYSRVVSIVTGASLRQMVLPGALAILAPIIIGFVLGKEALVGLLLGAIVTGFLLAVMMANAGGAWDNAKKYIEAGNLGGKGSDAHKAAVVGDTVGDPYKDTAGPSLNILIKLMSIVALIIAGLL